MPGEPWMGYGRFCPLARGLDLVGERWTLIIVQELFKASLRYGELLARLPGIGTSVLSDRLRKLERYGLVERRPRARGEPIVYALTEAGETLDAPLRVLREWGVQYLAATRKDVLIGPAKFDVTYTRGVQSLPDETYELRVGDAVTTLSFSAGHLEQLLGPAQNPALKIATDGTFMRRWAAGEIDWDGGRTEGTVIVTGDEDAWRRMLGATGYVREWLPSFSGSSAREGMESGAKP